MCLSLKRNESGGMAKMTKPTTDIPVTPEEDEAWETLPLKQGGFIIPSPTMLMGGAILALSITTFLFWNLYRSTANEYATYKAEVEAINEQIRVDTERKLAELADLQQRTEQNWRVALDALKSRPIRVRNDGCKGEMPSISVTPTGTNEAPAQLVISTGECEAVANNAVFDAAQVLHLQAFIRKQHEVTK